jgi:hypothetical protein
LHSLSVSQYDFKSFLDLNDLDNFSFALLMKIFFWFRASSLILLIGSFFTLSHSLLIAAFNDIALSFSIIFNLSNHIGKPPL